jgi:hypothetical protein
MAWLVKLTAPIYPAPVLRDGKVYKELSATEEIVFDDLPQWAHEDPALTIKTMIEQPLERQTALEASAAPRRNKKKKKAKS